MRSAGVQLRKSDITRHYLNERIIKTKPITFYVGKMANGRGLEWIGQIDLYFTRESG
jgi:hypothetical protein